jgi:hypothetical protein
VGEVEGNGDLIEQRLNVFCMESKDVTIIYVFGPKESWQDYLRGMAVPWLKIGQTRCKLNEDKWQGAATRVRAEKHTGIPVTCRFYEVFSYPFRAGALDTDFRAILTADMFNLANSIDNNKQITDPYEIKAGNEFVYNVTRSQILNAQAKFEHGLLVESLQKQNDDPVRSLLERLILDNQVSPFDDIETDTEDGSTKSEGYKNPDPLMKRVYENLPEEIGRITSLFDANHHYIIIKSARKGFWYSAGYSTRYRQTYVAYETKGGEKSRDMIRSLKLECDELRLSEQQGTKNKNKWSWRVTGSLDQTEDQVITWFVDNIKSMYSLFDESSEKLEPDGITDI